MNITGSDRESPKQRKSHWRRVLRQRRRSVPRGEAQAAAQRAARHLQDSPVWANTNHLALYLAGDGEMPTDVIADAARSAGKTVYLPVIDEFSLRFAPWLPDAPLWRNRYGIGEPTGASVTVCSLDLLLLPMVGFTASGFRLGMGGGYYDRCLSGVGDRRPILIGLAFGCQREPALDVLREDWDIGVDYVLSEEGLLRCRDQAMRPE